MRCPRCQLEIRDKRLRNCPRCGMQLPLPAAPLKAGNTAHALNAMNALDDAPPTEPGLPRFTLPAGKRFTSQTSQSRAASVANSPAASAPSPRATSHSRFRRRGAAFYPPMPAAPTAADDDVPAGARSQGQFTLIMSILSIVVLVALLFSLGALLLGSEHGKTAQHQATPTVPNSATETASAASTATAATLVYQSSLLGTTAGWANDAHCSGKADGYHISSGAICYAPVTPQSTIEITVTVEQVSGPTNLLYGLVLRNASKGNYYLFGIDGNGKWAFAKLSGTSSKFLIQPATNKAIKGQLKQTNTLQVKAVGSQFSFYVNGIQVGQTTDSSYVTGLIGLSSANGVEVLYTTISIAQPTA